MRKWSSEHGGHANIPIPKTFCKESVFTIPVDSFEEDNNEDFENTFNHSVEEIHLVIK